MSKPTSPHPYFEGFALTLTAAQRQLMEAKRLCRRTTFQAVMDALNEGHRPTLYFKSHLDPPPVLDEVVTSQPDDAFMFLHEGVVCVYRLGDLRPVTTLDCRFALWLLAAKPDEAHRAITQAATNRLLTRIPGAQAWF